MPVSSSLANFLFEAGNFLLLAAGLAWVLFKPVRRALDDERARRASADEESGEKRAQAETLLAEARAARDASEAEAGRLAREGTEAARADADRLRREAEVAQEQARRALSRELAVAREQQTAEVAEAVGALAAASLRRLLEEVDGPSLDLALARAAARALAKGRSESERTRATVSAHERALVESARPLGDETRAVLRGALGADFDERTVAELGAGVRVTTTSGQIDASARALSREAARQLAGRLAAQSGTPPPAEALDREAPPPAAQAEG